MRLSFPNGEHDDVVVERGHVCVGTEDGNEVAIADAGLAGRHACFRVDGQRGILLQVEPDAGAVHVNGRAVRRYAFLRLGDAVTLGRLQIRLMPERDADVDTTVPEPARGADEPTSRLAAARVVLRAVSGPLFGRAFPIVSPVVIGRGAGADVRLDDPALPQTLVRLENHGDRVVMRDLGGGEGCVVNGVPVRDAVLHPGDQIVIDQYRFVLEAPGLPPRGSRAFRPRPRAGAEVTGVTPVVRVDAPAPATAPRAGHVWWLIAAAAAIMLVLAALLLYAPRFAG